MSLRYVPRRFGRRLQHRRKALGLSLRQAATAVGCSHVYWCHVEQGTRRPPGLATPVGAEMVRFAYGDSHGNLGPAYWAAVGQERMLWDLGDCALTRSVLQAVVQVRPVIAPVWAVTEEQRITAMAAGADPHSPWPWAVVVDFLMEATDRWSFSYTRDFVGVDVRLRGRQDVVSCPFPNDAILPSS